jgi:hypothetical protein
MRRTWVVTELLAATGIALLALAAWWDPFVQLLQMLWSRVDLAGYMRSTLMEASRTGSGGIGSISFGFSEAAVESILTVSPSLLLWRAHAWLAAANIGGVAARRLAGIHKWTAIVAAIVPIINLSMAVFLLHAMGPEQGPLWVFAMFILPSIVLNAGVFVALAAGQIASALAGLAFLYGDNRG